MAKQNEKVVKKTGTPRIEVGTKGEMLVQGASKEEQRIGDLTIRDYRKMIDNDGQVQMIVNAIVNTIMAAGVQIVDDPEVTEEQSPSEEMQFIEQNLFTPLWKGGMSIPMERVNRTNLRGFTEGYRVSEVIYRKDPDGKIRLDRLAPRSGFSDAEMKLLVDDNGNYMGFHQTATFKNERIDVSVINDSGIKKTVKATFGGEFGSLYGRSGLKAAWYHYDKAHKGMFLNHVGHELGVLYPRIIKMKTKDADKQTAILNAMSRLHLESTISFSDEDAEVEFPQVTDPNVMKEGKQMIDFHYSAIAKSVLAQFVDLGSNISNSGSRSLADTQTDFFKEGLESVAQTLIVEPWNQIIADLIKMNFGGDIYPKLEIVPIEDERAEALFLAFQELVKKGNITEGIRAKLLEATSDQLDLGVSKEDIQADMEAEEAQKEQDKQLAAATQKANLEANVNNSEPVHNHIELEDAVPSSPTRALFPDEQKVKMVDIKRFWDNSRSQAEQIFREKLIKQKAGIIDQYITASREGQLAISRVNVELQDLPEQTYSESMQTIATQVFEFGKQTAADELEKAVPTTPKKDRTARTIKVDDVIKKQESDLEFRLKGVANNALSTNLPENDTVLALEQEYDDFWAKSLILAVGMLISEMMNKGRQVSFDKYSSGIFAYRYSAILDSRTTNFCESLDGRVFQSTDPDFALLSPPNHYNCRSMWVSISKGEEALGIVVDGKPQRLPVFSSVNSFKDATDISELSDESKAEQEIVKLLDIINE